MTRRAWLLLLIIPLRPAAAQGYRDASQPVETRVRDLLGRMTPEEKFWQLFMIPGEPAREPRSDYSHGIFGLQPDRADSASSPAADVARVNAMQRFFTERTRLGIPIIPFEEALHGLQRPGATSFPQAIALAATWDTALMERVGAAIARETRSRGFRQVLSPVINIASDVRWGRTEETYGEDPFLSSRMGDAYVAAMERAGVIATPKHFVANVGEGGRDSYPIEVSRRMLEELFFPPFASTIRGARARSVMTAYNSVDGQPATQNRALLTDQLRGAWGFTGFVISDAAATGGATVLHLTEPNTPAAAKHAWESGLDVVFQSSWAQYAPYWEAARTGMVADSVIDAAVARVLRAKFEQGLFDRPLADADSAAFWNGHPTHRALALEAARAGIVLLRNEGGILPLRAGADRVSAPDLVSARRRSGIVTVIGSDAVEARLGGYSGPGNHVVSILDAIRARLGDALVRYAAGPTRESLEVESVPPAALAWDSAGTARRGVRAEYFDNIAVAGQPRVVRGQDGIALHYTFNGPARGIGADWFSARYAGRLTVPAGRPRRIGFEGSDGWRLWVDGRLAIDNWRKQTSRRLMTGPLAPGAHDVRFEYFETTGNAIGRLVWGPEVPRDAFRAAMVDSAVALARGSDVAIVVAGIEEGEFRDRSSLGLPGYQSQLIEALAAAGNQVLVVLIGGSAITMPWLDRVAAVIDAWYPGEAGGEAVVDVLFGDANPAGRLPITFPVSEGQLPLRYNHKPTGRGDDYLDLSGQPLFPFGFGLSYTTFEYSALRISPGTIDSSGTATVRCRVRNTGTRAGDEVVQLYVRDVLASVARPVMELKGFRRVHLAPGAETEVTFTLGPDALSMLDVDLRRVVEPGTFRVLIGSSSKDIRLRGDLVVRQ